MAYERATKKRAKEAINDLFSDTSVSREKTRDDLEELRDEILSLLATLEDS